MITTYPNQRMIGINREMPQKTKGSQRPYIVAYWDNVAAASKKLNGVAFKLYCYCLGNSDKYNLVFSPRDFTNQFGGSIKSAQTAFNELKENGYLKDLGHNHYEFYEVPQIPQSTVFVPTDELTAINNFIEKNGYNFDEITRFLMSVFYYTQANAEALIDDLLGEGKLEVK